MSSRVIECESDDSLCESKRCRLRFICRVSGAGEHKVKKSFAPRTEAVVAGTNVTLTCHDYDPSDSGEGVVICGRP